MVRFVSKELRLVSVLKRGAMMRSVRGLAQRGLAGKVKEVIMQAEEEIPEIFRRSTPFNLVKDCMREKREVRLRMTTRV